MTERKQCEFQLIRYVPDPVKNEFVNIGVLLSAGEQSALRFTRDWARVRCLDPDADTEMLEALELEIGLRLNSEMGYQPGVYRSIRELLESSLSNGIQITESKGYLAENFPAGLEDLLRLYVDSPKTERRQRRHGRHAVLTAMRMRFKQAGVWALMHKHIPAANYTEPGDPLHIDCGYRNGVLKLFQAVSLETDAVDAKLLAYSAQSLREGVQRAEKVSLQLTAIIEPIGWAENARSDKEREVRYSYASSIMTYHKIRVLTTSDLAEVAEIARRELRI